MEIFNVGALELIAILVIMFIVLGPKDMVLTAARVGRTIRSFIKSPMWREILAYAQEIRELPQKLMDETGLEETLKEVRETTQEATNEINEQLKEVTEAARVPEMEHVRIGENGLIVPPTLLDDRPAVLSVAPPPADAFQESVAQIAAAGAASQPAVLPVSEPARPGAALAALPVIWLPRRDRRPQDDGPAAAMAPAPAEELAFPPSFAPRSRRLTGTAPEPTPLADMHLVEPEPAHTPGSNGTAAPSAAPSSDTEPVEATESTRLPASTDFSTSSLQTPDGN